MHVKSTILVALMIASMVLARGITSRVEEDGNNNNNNEETMESYVESAADRVIVPSSAPGCVLAANAPTDRTLGNTDQTHLSSGRSILDMINNGRRANLERIRNGIMRASSYPSNSILQILDNIDLLRSSENRESLTSIIPNLIDSLIPPQMQYVDNTLRLMAIKNSIDDLLAKIFPNLHMIQHPEEHNK